MNKFVKSLYKFLCFRDNPRKSETQNKKEMVNRLMEIFMSNEAFEFVDMYGQPGNMLYGEFIKEKTRRIREKINSTGGIVF